MSGEIPPPAEIVPEPGVGRVFEQRMRPGIADVAPSGRARLDGGLRTLLRLDSEARQDPGGAAATLRGGTGAAHLLQRDRPLLRRAADRDRRARRLGPDGRNLGLPRSGTAGADAHSTISSRPSSARARGGRGASIRLRHPGPPAEAKTEEEAWVFRETDLDIAGHVNNSHYWAALESELPGDGEAATIGVLASIRRR